MLTSHAVKLRGEGDGSGYPTHAIRLGSWGTIVREVAGRTVDEGDISKVMRHDNLVACARRPPFACKSAQNPAEGKPIVSLRTCHQHQRGRDGHEQQPPPSNDHADENRADKATAPAASVFDQGVSASRPPAQAAIAKTRSPALT
jgi:hypothetical protein